MEIEKPIPQVAMSLQEFMITSQDDNYDQTMKLLIKDLNYGEIYTLDDPRIQRILNLISSKYLLGIKSYR